MGMAKAWWQPARRVLKTLLGVVLILVGIVMLPLPGPGPGWPVIFAGLGVLATEYAWAKRLLHRLKMRLRRGSTEDAEGASPERPSEPADRDDAAA